MKEGWEYKKLGEVCNVVGGGTPNTKIKEYWNGNIPWATVSDMNCDEITCTGYYISDRGLKESSSRIIKKGEIIIATRVGLGKVCKLAVDSAINQDLKGIIPKDDRIFRNFIFYFFKYKAKHIIDNGIGATVKGVKIKFIEELPFGFPTLSEQQSIVAYLDSAFAKIDAMKANAEKALNEAKALFQASLKEMLEPKEGWEKDKLINVFNFIDYRGATPKKLTYGVPLVTAKNVKYGYLDYTIKDFISEEEYKQRQSRGISHKGDLLFTTEAPLGNVAIADLDRFSAGQRLITLQQYNNSKYKIDNRFYYYYMMGPLFQKAIRILATGATALGIKAKLLKDVEVPITTYIDQISIVATLDSLKSKVDQLQANFDKISQECDALKQAILRQVFE